MWLELLEQFFDLLFLHEVNAKQNKCILAGDHSHIIDGLQPRFKMLIGNIYAITGGIKLLNSMFDDILTLILAAFHILFILHHVFYHLHLFGESYVHLSSNILLVVLQIN